jgi:hypothetical protein
MEQPTSAEVIGRNIGALMNRSILTLFAILASTTVASAQGTSGTPEDRAACQASVQRFCTQAIQGGDMVVLACLQQNRPRISKSCQQVLIKYGQ